MGCHVHAKLQQLTAAVFRVPTQRGESDAAVDMAIEASAYNLAVETMEAHCPQKTQEVYFQLARHKEACGDIADAEKAYLKAQAPAAAIALYKKRVYREKNLRMLFLATEKEDFLLWTSSLPLTRDTNPVGQHFRRGSGMRP